ncbi:hypothetical protein [Actinophytocola gossypii]|uniref:Uncharacterized protein n=1 Tax=Actinophytocola gossypii TaxID=2812003 RepID=A0ABT2JGP4_9PSEU|nr:hypothetical protein [Actinophytocola gossypii]MCT2586699.1 hypothetical protein [Actinophytocola gossypii]
MSYPPQPGYYPSQPGYGPYRPAGPGTAPAYLAAGLFLLAGILALVTAIVGMSGDSSDNPDLMAALIGLAFSGDLTGNRDFAISFTMSVACTTITFALLLFTRMEWVRWVLAFVGAITVLYYIYGIIWLLSHDAGEVIAMVVVSWLLWTAATVVVLLPHTRRAMRDYQRKLAQHGYPHGYPQQPPPMGYRPY